MHSGHNKYRTLDLFAGIGGFAIGLEAAGGFHTSAFSEIDPYASAVLAARWPGVPNLGDIRSITLEPDTYDVLTGGFPCQDISTAGRGAGLEGSRSRLWWEFHRLIQEGRPKYVIIENSPALRARGLDQVLRSLDEIGYDAEWNCIPAAAAGAPHRRDRCWIIAWDRLRVGHGQEGNPQRSYSDVLRRYLQEEHGRAAQLRDNEVREPGSVCDDVADTYHQWELQQEGSEQEGWGRAGHRRGWRAEPHVGRVAYGVPSRVDRIKCLGNAVVPKIPELIGRAILEMEES